MRNNDDNSEEIDTKLNLDKDDEDESDSIGHSSSKMKDIEDKDKKSPPGAPRIYPKKPPYRTFLFEFSKRFIGKHRRSFDSSNSSNSSNSSIDIVRETGKKRKLREMTTFQKLYVESQKENYDKNYGLLKEDFKLLEEYESTIFKNTNLDIMFIMDLTGSMGIWLNEAKKSVKNIIEEIIDNNPGAKIRMSFIGYRDFLDVNEKRQYDNQEFTENIDEFNNFLSKLDCSGGGDEPEDIVGALRQALNMNWVSKAKYAILVCDAPCHGKQYHNISYDKFSDGDPEGKLEDVMKVFCDKGITFYCIEINHTTKKMFNIMKDIYNDENKFHVEKLGNSVHQFSFFVAFSASVLLGNEKYSKVKFTDILTNYRNETIEKIMKKYINNNGNINVRNNDSMTLQLIDQIENLNLGGEDKKLFDFINRMNDLSINKDQKEQNMLLDNNSNINNISNNNNFITNISVDDVIKLDKKEINYIVKALSYNKNPNSVNDWVNPTIEEKIFKTKLQISFDTLKKDTDKNEYEIYFVDKILDKNKSGSIPFSLDNNLYNNSSQYLRKIAYDELICEQIADYFNAVIEVKLPYLKQFIKFQRHILYEIEDQNVLNDIGLKNKYIVSEDSNSIQIMTASLPNKRVLQCFTHFSYQLSGGQLIINDIKYDNELKKVTYFKIYSLKENGYKNILEFFSSHICDNTCKSLDLAHPRKKLNPILIKDSFFSGKYLMNINLCLCCSAPFHAKADKDGNKSLNCGFCSWKETNSKINSICSKCQTPFSYSSYSYNCQLINYPNKCEKCNSKFYNINN